MKKNLFVLFVLLAICTNNTAQNLESESDSSNTKSDLRKVFVYSSVGVLEAFSVGAGYQVSSEFAISLKWSSSIIGGTSILFPNSATGIGIRTSYYFPFFIFNNITFDSILYLNQRIYKQSSQFIKGYFLDLTIGKEIIDESGLRVFWGVGLSGSHPIDVAGRFSVSFKIGLNYNFYSSQ
jgi:hypothetical protein